jgi:hypothetical protein
MARKISGTEAGKIQKAKDAASKENYGGNSVSDKTFAIAKKQGAVSKGIGNVPAGRTTKERNTLTNIQVNRKNDLAKTAGRAALIETMAKKKATTKAPAKKMTEFMAPKKKGK